MARDQKMVSDNSAGCLGVLHRNNIDKASWRSINYLPLPGCVVTSPYLQHTLDMNYIINIWWLHFSSSIKDPIKDGSQYYMLTVTLHYVQMFTLTCEVMMQVIHYIDHSAEFILYLWKTNYKCTGTCTVSKFNIWYNLLHVFQM